MPQPPNRARELAVQSRLSGDPVGWFEQIYQEHEQGLTTISWADLKANPNLLEFSGAGKKALVVGCGFGDDAEQLAKWDFETTAFDVSPTAINACKRRFPESTVTYVAADLLKPPAEWARGFDFVLESYTLQVLPPEVRRAAIKNVAGFVRDGGTILLIARGREENEPEGQMPWPLTRREVELFTGLGLREESFEDYMDNESPPVRRFRALFFQDHQGHRLD